MSEPEVPTVTASVPRSGSGSRAASGCGLSESLHAVAPSSIATAAANQHRPPPRTMRLPPEGSLPPLQFAAPRGQKPDRLLVQRLQQVSAVSPRRARGTVPRRCAVASGRHRHHGPLPRRNNRAAGSGSQWRGGPAAILKGLTPLWYPFHAGCARWHDRSTPRIGTEGFRDPPTVVHGVSTDLP